jgi:pyruvate-ferredoxin/flavodoxin oxidoreductase
VPLRPGSPDGPAETLFDREGHMPGIRITLDGNEAAARIAYQVSEVIAIYPITPSSPMGEWTDQWASEGRPNLWGDVPRVVEMQSEAGAAGTVHGALQGGALSATFTSSQGLLLMIPNMYKIAGELTPTVFHVAARTVAAHALSIFGDQSDVMACRQTGWAMVASNSVQEAADLALIAHAATLEARVPFLHFFDGFRTSHEVARIELSGPDQLRSMIDDDRVREHRQRGLSPDRPVLRGTSQNPDVYFQSREACNPFYLATPAVVQAAMDKFAALTGRTYRLFDYVGTPDAERVLIMMGSGAEAAHETVDALTARGEKVGLLKVRLYRPFDAESFRASLPPSAKTLVVLDRTKEPGAIGEPLYLDVVAAINEDETGFRPRVIGGRYGLSSKEFTPAMAKAVFDTAGSERPRNHFTVGITDDVTHTSLTFDPSFSTEDPATVKAVFFGLGSDGTVGANKNSIKIIGEDTDYYAQGYFVYDSKKSGSVTVSHLRFGPRPIRSTYLIREADFVGCHHFGLLGRMDVLKLAKPGGVLLLNAPHPPEQLWDRFPRRVQEEILVKGLKVYAIDADRVAREQGMSGRINTVMQTCFFAVSGVLPRAEAIDQIKKSINKTYGKRGLAVVEKNFAAVDASLGKLYEVPVPDRMTADNGDRTSASPDAPGFVHKVVSLMMAGKGDDLPVSALPCDGTFPVGTAKWEKRNIAAEIPVWEEKLCIQCGKCVYVCPHAVIRAKVYGPAAGSGAPPAFKAAAARWPDRKGELYTLQVSPDDCTGCRICVEACPVKDKSQASRRAINMAPQPPLRAAEAENWDFFLNLPEVERSSVRLDSVKDVQLLQPLFEFSGACSGCGETPYIKLLTQLFGDRAMIANATGCSSIYGGNLPTTPYAANAHGRGPAWSNSLFEDNAEFGLGLRLAADQQNAQARLLAKNLQDVIGTDLVRALLDADQDTEAGVDAQRERVVQLRERLSRESSIDNQKSAKIADLAAIADALVKKCVWILGGDGWAYDIGYGGVDHVLNSGANVKLLVLDTEVYSNTGGQMSKSTPRGAVAKFAASGKPMPKKDLAALAVMQGNCYVARVAFGADDKQTLAAFREAEAFDGPALIIAYSHCIAHGYDLARGLDQQTLAVQTGYWPLFRFNPALKAAGEPPLHLDSKPPSLQVQKFMYNETRFTMLAQARPAAAMTLLDAAQEDVNERWKMYERLAVHVAPGRTLGNGAEEPTPPLHAVATHRVAEAVK